MVIRRGIERRSAGVFLIEAMVGIAILVLATVPLSVWLMTDARSFRDTYRRAIAVELVDGETEILAAGDWRNYAEGTNVCHVRGDASANLPEGQFLVIRHGDRLRLEWRGANKSSIGIVAREIIVK